MKAFLRTLKVELKLSIRDMNMIIFALILPLIVTMILGFVYGDNPAYEGAQYTSFQLSFGAMASFGIIASGVMGLPLVLSDYRDKKILKRYRCTPVSPSFLLVVQVVKYAIYSFAGFAAAGIVAACFGYVMPGNFGIFFGAFCLTLVAIYSIGMLVAALAPSTQSAGLICALLYFPMLILSGTTLPYEIMPRWLQIISEILPLTQGIKLLKGTSIGAGIGEIYIPIIVLSALSIICISLSIKFFKWDKRTK